MGKSEKSRKSESRSFKKIHGDHVASSIQAKKGISVGPKSFSKKQEKRNLKRILKQGNKGNNIAALKGPTAASGASVYKRNPSYPMIPAYNSKTSTVPLPLNNFVTESHPAFNDLVDSSYRGFVVETNEKFPIMFHRQFQEALKDLESKGCYQFDMTQPAGLNTKVARTYVTRCLIGEPGMTYKYLGLRMFAHPWASGAKGASEAMVRIGELNNVLTQHSIALNRANSSSDNFGSCKFNLTLINRCFPDGEMVSLKKEPMFEQQNSSVSWHADSSLDHYSTIAVYHWDESIEEDMSKRKYPWQVALRVSINAEGPNQGKPAPHISCDVPPIAATLPKQCCYYLLDEFNHHHQHTVLAGDSFRFASTHRVSRIEGHTYGYILQRCQGILSEKLKADKVSIRKLLLVTQEAEFEWIRQFYIQGSKHHDMHTWWHEPMETLRDLILSMENRIFRMFVALGIAAKDTLCSAEDGAVLQSLSGKAAAKVKALVATVEKESFSEMISGLTERSEKRQGWKAREADPSFKSCSEDAKPLTAPLQPVFEVWLPVTKAANSSSTTGDTGDKKKSKEEGKEGRKATDATTVCLDMLQRWSIAFQST